MAPGADLSMNASRRRAAEARQEKSFRIIEAASAAARLEAATSFLRQCPADQPITIVGATRGAADDLARRIAVERGATIGLARFSLTQLAARTAVVALAAEGKTASTGLGAEAVAARAVFAAMRDGSLRYFTPVAGLPGFPRALARTLQELRPKARGPILQTSSRASTSRLPRSPPQTVPISCTPQGGCCGSSRITGLCCCSTSP